MKIGKKSSKKSTNINRKGLQRTANEHAEERRIYKDLISKNNQYTFQILQAEHRNAGRTS